MIQATPGTLTMWVSDPTVYFYVAPTTSERYHTLCYFIRVVSARKFIITTSYGDIFDGQEEVLLA